MPDSPLHPGSDEEWQALLRQLRLSAEAQPQPFFYARVRARLLAQADPTPAWLAGWLRWPAYVAVLGALVLAVRGDGPGTAIAYHSPQRAYPALKSAR